jgi:hypothetical protein
VVEDVLAEVDGGRFALTEVGERLRADVPGPLRGPIVVRGELYYQAAAGILAACRSAMTPANAQNPRRCLLAQAGFQVDRVVPTGSPAGLSIIEATLTSA